MKNLYTIVFAVILSASLWAQAPQSFSYQAVIRGSNNDLVANKPVGMKISLLQGSETGAEVYVETHTPTSNANGLVNVAIGNGTKLVEDFATIDWSKGPYFIKTETDPTGGTSYSLTNVSQLLSVPFALYAANSQPGPKGDKGETGAQGLPGKDGVDGKNGLDGKEGIQGPKGDTGATGAQGIQGEKGEQGLPGKDGKNGVDGKDGLPGPKGEIGLTGAQGPIGLTGPKGDTGAQGIQGEKGEQGLPGKDGKNGVDGKDGLPGPKGDIGLTGAQGPIGLTGPKGDQGIQGNGFSNGTATNQLSYWDGSSWTILNPGTIGQTLTMCEDGLTWTTGGVCPTRPTSGYGANVIDVDGNTYKTVYIGTQKWMAENLKTSKYNDGTTIPNITDNTQWSNNTTGAWAYYNNDAANNAKYGKLYNWYAVSPTTNGNKNVCPIGWHVPTNAEWTILTDYLGGESVAGGKMKEVGTVNWASPNTDATNISLFTGLPDGYRHYNGNYIGQGNNGNWWSTTDVNISNAWSRGLDYNMIDAYGNDYGKRYGFSVRCLRD